MIKNKRNFLFNLLLMLISLSISLVVGEYILRQMPSLQSYNEVNKTGPYVSAFKPIYPNKYYTHYHNEEIVINKKEFKLTLKYNSLGFVDNEFVKKKAKNEKRILCLGDSFTQGIGASEQNMSWPKQLEQMLNAESDSTLYNVYNCGLSGCDPYYSYVIYNELLADYNFDHVILLINQSDIDDYLFRGGFNRFNTDGSVSYNPTPASEKIYARFFTYRLIHKALGYNYHFIKQKDFAAKIAEANDSLYAVCQIFNTSCIAKNQKFTALCIPMTENFEGLVNQLSTLERTLKNSNIHSIIFEEMLRKEFKTDQAIKNLYWPIDRHFNNEGYHFLAKTVKENLDKTQ